MQPHYRIKTHVTIIQFYIFHEFGRNVKILTLNYIFVEKYILLCIFNGHMMFFKQFCHTHKKTFTVFKNLDPENLLLEIYLNN